ACATLGVIATFLGANRAESSLKTVRTSLPTGHYQVRDQDLHGFTILVHGGCPDFDEPLLRPRPRWSHLEHLAFDAELVTGPHRPGPADLVDPGAGESARGLELAFDQKPHRHRRGVPTTRDQSTENRVTRRLFVKVEGLRIELGSERLGPLSVYGQLS